MTVQPGEARWVEGEEEGREKRGKNQRGVRKKTQEKGIVEKPQNVCDRAGKR